MRGMGEGSQTVVEEKGTDGVGISGGTTPRNGRCRGDRVGAERWMPEMSFVSVDNEGESSTKCMSCHNLPVATKRPQICNLASPPHTLGAK